MADLRRHAFAALVLVLVPVVAGCTSSAGPADAGGDGGRGGTGGQDTAGRAGESGPEVGGDGGAGGAAGADGAGAPDGPAGDGTTGDGAMGDLVRETGGAADGSDGDAARDGGNGSDAAACPVEPPLRGLKVRFVAGAGVTLEGTGVASWADQAGQGQAAATQGDAGRRPTVRAGAVGGKPALHFDGENDMLSFRFPVTGRDQMTISAVSRTWVYQLGSYNADCDFIGGKDGLSDVGRELNCSGTDQNLLTWNEGGGAFKSCGIFYGVGQTEVTFRFGTGQGYRFFKTPFVLVDPPRDRFVWSAAAMAGHARTFYLDGRIPQGARDYRDATPFALETRADRDEGGGTHAGWPAAVGDTEPTAWIGRGRFEPATSFWAGELAELLVYDVALSDAERAALGRYVGCAYFAGRTFP